MRCVGCALLGIVLGCLLSMLATGKGERGQTYCDTLVYIDTVRYDAPILRDSVVIAYKAVKVKIIERDTLAQSDNFGYLCRGDSAVVELPIEQRVYADTAYTAWVSGWQPRLDSIEVYPRSLVVRQTTKPPRWSVGAQAGVGLTPKGVQPYVGIGVALRIDLR